MAITKNVGGTDRAIRIILGIVLLLLVSLAFVGPQTPWAYLGLIGFVLIFTGITGFCLPYKWLGINTRKEISKEE
jgi:hypothetical protein